ncbi:polar amino acid transport system substrate-binding protein [Geosporobacter subterraneus DSM 17957]|uniref:histidine kinase n=1 Tax=Geosporobacter subterraneus DSM 17957 TaxID=1121919 RepID=A0A1M6QLX3_9FIRM|nr:transporter substrate-binding domain-containing protein [Geosporobacter subterraneus]SHK21178.1 polar amino acid transport system substrate-binding protein [Geosporobacter subterraneus DSM 17957]
MNKRIFYSALIILMVAISMYFSIIGYADVITDLKNHKNPILTFEEQRWLKEQGSLIYAADNNAPPLRFVDAADNQYKGVVVDYINLLSLELGVNIELHPLLWQDALKSLEEGKSDICDMFRSKERSKHFLFTNPIYNLRAVLVVNSNHRGTSSLESMVLATQKGDYVNEYLINTYPDIKIIQVDNVCSALDLLLDGKVDAVAGDEPVVLYQIKNKNAESTLHIKETPLYEEEVVFAVPKSKPQLVTIINKGIAALNDTNQLERIQQKWFGISAPIVQLPDYSTRIKYILVIAGFLMMIVVGMVTWNYFLKQEVERRTKELLDSKHDLQITFDGMTEYIAVTDLDLKIVNINKSFLDCLGYSQSQVLNRHCREIFQHFNSVNIENMIADTIASGENLEEEITNMGNYYVVRTYPLKDTRGSMKNILIVIQNITKEKISEKQILQANKMAAIGQLAAGMGHEIRNPLGIIRNHSYILRALYEEEKIVRSLDYIDASVERASRIIDNLLEFSRLTGDDKRWIYLKDFIAKILELEHKTLMKLNIEYSVECSENIRLYSNIESLKHILINLISNAVDAIGENGSIRITVSSNEERISLSVEDTGKGIPEDQLEKIFNPFYSTKDPGKGTGLGLYIVYNEVEKLNGHISVTSIPYEKTVFEISLPTGSKENVI